MPQQKKCGASVHHPAGRRRRAASLRASCGRLCALLDLDAAVIAMAELVSRRRAHWDLERGRPYVVELAAVLHLVQRAQYAPSNRHRTGRPHTRCPHRGKAPQYPKGEAHSRLALEGAACGICARQGQGCTPGLVWHAHMTRQTASPSGCGTRGPNNLKGGAVSPPSHFHPMCQ
jgi:hypothetical protein